MILIFILLLPVILPLFTKEIAGTTDNLLHLFRVVNLKHAILQGYLLPRWAADVAHGLGEPLFNFNYPLPYYVVVFLHFAGFSLNTASQVFAAITLIFSAVFMYLFLKEHLRNLSAFIGAVAYVYFPYHLHSVFIAGDWGTWLAFAFLPLIFWTITKMAKTGNLKWIIASIIAFFLLILSHNLLAILSTMLLITYLPLLYVGQPKKKIFFTNIMLVFLFSALLTSWFWLPAIFENKLIGIKAGFVYAKVNRGFFFDTIAPILKNSSDLLAFKRPSTFTYPTVSLFSIFSAIILMIYIFKKSILEKKREHFYLVIFALFWFLFSIFMTRSASNLLWKVIPGIDFIAYPYRFFYITTFSAAIIFSFLFNLLVNKSKTLVTLLSILVLVWQGIILTRPNIDYFNFSPSYFNTEQTTRYAPLTYKNMGVDFLPATADYNFAISLDNKNIKLPKVEIIKGEGRLILKKNKVQDLEFMAMSQTPLVTRINTFYFPGWMGTVDDKAVVPKLDKEGRMIFKLSKGEHTVALNFVDTPIRLFSKLLSIFSLIALSAIVAIAKKKQAI